MELVSIASQVVQCFRMLITLLREWCFRYNTTKILGSESVVVKPAVASSVVDAFVSAFTADVVIFVVVCAAEILGYIDTVWVILQAIKKLVMAHQEKMIPGEDQLKNRGGE